MAGNTKDYSSFSLENKHIVHQRKKRLIREIGE